MNVLSVGIFCVELAGACWLYTVALAELQVSLESHCRLVMFHSELAELRMWHLRHAVASEFPLPVSNNQYHAFWVFSVLLSLWGRPLRQNAHSFASA